MGASSGKFNEQQHDEFVIGNEVRAGARFNVIRSATINCMNEDKAESMVELFPLCDQRGDISRVLGNARAEPGTRADALVFAWLLDLPVGVDPAQAAGALLTVAGKRSSGRRSGRQKTLLRELRAIANGRVSAPQAGSSRSKQAWPSLLKKKKPAV